MRPIRSLTAAALATLVALAGITVQASPATAADPAPTQSAAPIESPAATPAATPAPAAIDLSPTPAPTATPAVAAVVAPPPTPPPSRAQVLAGKLRLVARIAMTRIHARYVWGTAGPNTFDCSGLVRYAYRKAGISNRLGGGHSSVAMLMWGRIHHLTSRVNPQIGDVAVWGNGSHVGIYIGGGKVISALNPRQGVKITGVYALTGRFTTFIHTGR